MKKYNVFSLEGRLLYTGDENEIHDVFGARVSSIRYAINKGARLMRKYYVREVGLTFEEEVEELYTHLLAYGNTIKNENPQKLVDALKEKGMNVRVRKDYLRSSVDDPAGDSMKCPQARGKKDWYYILEVI